MEVESGVMKRNGVCSAMDKIFLCSPEERDCRDSLALVRAGGLCPR